MGSLATTESPSFPVYNFDRAEDGYIEGYKPASLLAPHSSLLKNSTWIGFGLILSSMPGFYLFITGLAGLLLLPDNKGADVTRDITLWDPMLLTIGGGITAVFCLIVGSVFIRTGRRDFRAYRKRTGRTV